MSRQARAEPDIDAVFENGGSIDRALAREVYEAVRRHKLLGESVVVWRDGKPTSLPADAIQVEFDSRWLPRIDLNPSGWSDE